MDRPALTKKGWRTPVEGDAGFVDLVLAHPVHGVIMAELKNATAVLDPEQTMWRTALEPNGCYHLWRPADLRSGRIDRILMGIQP